MTGRVFHLSTDDITGGAARCAYRLHAGLIRLGHDSRMLVGRRRSADPAVQLAGSKGGLSSALRRRVHRWRHGRTEARYARTWPERPEAFSDGRSPHRIDWPTALSGCDVVNLHRVEDFLDYESFFRSAPSRVPLVWTFHDMHALTGGCAYAAGCDRFEARCGACPQLGSRDERDASRRTWERKHALFDSVPPDRLRVVTPSRWMAREVRRSSLMGGRFQVTVIPYGLDTDDFAPRDRSAARDVLGIPRDARVVLFVAQVLNNRRKGFAALAEAVESIRDLPRLFLLSLGSGAPTLDLPVPHVHLTNVGNDRLLSVIYSAADAFVLPSLQDNLPATALEALACGTPVIGFDAGGVPEIVRDGVTGRLAPAGDVAALAGAIRELLSDPVERERLADQCRRTAVQEYALEVQARRYVELYREVEPAFSQPSPESYLDRETPMQLAQASLEES
jgi:glycosyltransferase involved in cell wall biosynthesis